MPFIVTEKAMRPASSARQCFYCSEQIGQEHKADCVLIKKTVRIKMTIEYDIEVPNHWTKENVEFQRNEGSWCAGNVMTELENLMPGDVPCLCATPIHFEYLNEVLGSTALDE